MKYCKAPLTLEQQVDQLVARGMIGDKAVMVRRLGATNYYRLSGYWHPFREVDARDGRTQLDTFRGGTKFDEVWCRYVFDRRLRLVVMDAIERIEVAVRTQLMYHHAHEYGPFGYATVPASLPKLGEPNRSEFLQRLLDEFDQSKDAFADHFRIKYGDFHAHPPAWILAEVMTFGSMLTFFRNASKKVKQNTANLFGMPEPVLESWLLLLNVVRNICAHHGRLWNRELGVKPFVPRIDQYPEWHTPVKVPNTRVFAILTICKWSIDRVAPQSQWGERIRMLLRASPGIPIDKMGIPANWEQCPIWRVASPEASSPSEPSAAAVAAPTAPSTAI